MDREELISIISHVMNRLEDFYGVKTLEDFGQLTAEEIADYIEGLKNEQG